MKSAVVPAGTDERAVEGGRGGRIVIGFDGSPVAQHALQWGIVEAQRRGAPCRVIEAWTHGAGAMDDPRTNRDLLEHQLASLVHDTCTDVGMNPPLDVEFQLGDPVDLLSEAARHADLLVVGSRGQGAVRSFLLGSVSADLLHIGAGPMIVVPPTASIRDERRRVVVGVDGSESASRAMRWARDEAQLRGCDLVAVHAWHTPVAMGSLYAPTIAVPFEECRDAAQEFLDRTVHELRADGGVNVVPHLVEGVAGHELVAAAAEADLLVVGTRGHNEMLATVLGSTSHNCVHHSMCAIAVIP